MITCDCGAAPEAIVHTIQRSGHLRLTYYRCTVCRREWTVREETSDITGPIDSDEVVAVHEAIQRSNLTIEDMVRGPD